MNNQEKIWDLEYKKNKVKWKKERHYIPNILKNKRVLEIGVGNGKNISEIIKQKPGALFALDISQEAINLCKGKFKSKNLHFIKRDIRNSGFSDNSFDVVLCYYVLNNFLEKDRRTVVNEIYRLLCKNGILIFEDFMKGDLRQSEIYGKPMEKNTLLKNNGLICHFFTKAESRKLFKKLRINNLEEKEFKIILKNPKLKRKLISVEASKLK